MAHPSIGRANQGNGFPAVNLPNAASKLARAVSSVVDGCLPPLTGVDRRLPNVRNDGTKPKVVAARPATPRHLAVARMLADGKTNPQIAVALGVTRQAVWKWSRMPAVIAEVARTHSEMVRSRVYKS